MTLLYIHSISKSWQSFKRGNIFISIIHIQKWQLLLQLFSFLISISTFVYYQYFLYVLKYFIFKQYDLLFRNYINGIELKFHFVVVFPLICMLQCFIQIKRSHQLQVSAQGEISMPQYIMEYHDITGILQYIIIYFIYSKSTIDLARQPSTPTATNKL